MKKRYGLLIGLLMLSVLAVGCRKKNIEEESTPTPTPTIETSQNDNIVSMEQSTGIDKSRITKIMGTKTATSSDLVITNNTGLEIKAFYTRPNGEEEWSEDYIQGKFTLKDREQGLYYYEPSQTDENGTTITRYDLRVAYMDEDESDCLFRNLTLSDIEELKLNMEDGVPFVTYISLSTKREISTLEDAKARMGRTDKEDYGDDENELDSTLEPTEKPHEVVDNTQDPAADPSDSSNYNSDNNVRAAAEGFIGQSIDSLIGAIGGANAFEYEDNLSGNGTQNGYYYYDGFTVTTEVDENGNETITGIW